MRATTRDFAAGLDKSMPSARSDAEVPVEGTSSIRILADRNRISNRTDPEAHWVLPVAAMAFQSGRIAARRAASSTASIMLDGSAIPLPAMSNAVP